MLTGDGNHRCLRKMSTMKPIKRLPLNTVFLLPLVALAVGLISVNAANERARELYDIRFNERLEADAALRMLIRDSTVERALKDVDDLVALLTTRSSAGIDIFNDSNTRTLVDSLASQLPKQNLHFIIGSVSKTGLAYIEYSHPRVELVGREISQHPMLADFDLFMAPPFTDQVAYRASRTNDLSFTSDGLLVIRRMLLELPHTERKLLLIAKVNSYERQRAIDSVLRELGPIPSLIYTIMDPNSDECLMSYVAGVGEKVCSPKDQNVMGGVVSEKFGALVVLRPTDAYVRNFEGGGSPFAYTELFVTLIASGFAFMVAIFFRRRLDAAEREILNYKGSLDSKEQLTASLHSMVVDNLEQVGALARKVKNASVIENEERRYLNIALSEIGQLRLSLDARIISGVAGAVQKLHRSGVVDTRELCQNLRRELERIAEGEGLECRLLADDDLPGTLTGSQYWIESAIMALINASQTFTDEGFIEISIWAETSMTGHPELFIRCRDTGIGWSSDLEADHGPAGTLRAILSGLGADFQSKSLPAAVGQEHVIHFIRA